MDILFVCVCVCVWCMCVCVCGLDRRWEKKREETRTYDHSESYLKYTHVDYYNQQDVCVCVCVCVFVCVCEWVRVCWGEGVGKRKEGTKVTTCITTANPTSHSEPDGNNSWCHLSSWVYLKPELLTIMHLT